MMKTKGKKMTGINTYETKDADMEVAQAGTQVCLAAMQSMCLANSSLETTGKASFGNGLKSVLTSTIDPKNKKVILKVEVDITGNKEVEDFCDELAVRMDYLRQQDAKAAAEGAE